jgi:hypothetical protein
VLVRAPSERKRTLDGKEKVYGSIP